MPVLTMIDLLQIQQYIASSNKLKEIVGGSKLVSWATSKSSKSGLISELGELGAVKNMIYGAGGNILLKFNDLDEAKKFSSKFCRALYESAPGLECVICHKKFSNNDFVKTFLNLQKEINELKTCRKPSLPLLGISVTAICRSTGKPAYKFDSEDRAISREIDLKNKKAEGVYDNYDNIEPCRISLRSGKEIECRHPLDIDHLGRTRGETSLVGIVHIDGNQIGKKIYNWLIENKNSPEIEQKLKEISKQLDDITKEAFKAVEERVCNACDEDENGRICIFNVDKEKFELQRENNIYYLPLRKIFVSGDDITFICDGRIAFDLAETVLKYLEKERIPHLGKITASAGIAIVHSHAPFYRAFELAYELCKSAKEITRENEKSALDWQIGLPRKSLKEIRKIIYQTSNGNKLTMRPYPLENEQNPPIHSWYYLTRKLLIEHLKQWPRSKAKHLAQIVREGEEEVRETLQNWKITAPEIKLPEEIAEDGYWGEETPIIDAIELLDIYWQLKKEGK